MPAHTNCIIRSAEAHDATAIAELANALAKQVGGSGTAMTPGRVVKDFLSPELGLSVEVAEMDGSVVAYALHGTAYETAFAESGRYLSDLYVAPAARRRGIARALMARVAGIAASEGGSFIWWVSKAATADADRLYASLSDFNEPVTAFAVTREKSAN